MKVPSIILVTAGLLLATSTGHAQQADPDLWIANGGVNVARVSGNTLYIGGGFTRVAPQVGGLATLTAAAGTVVPGWPKVVGSVAAVVSDGAGGWYIGGTFTHVGGQPRGGLAHILSDLTVAPWNPGTDGFVSSLARSGFAVYIGGAFSQVGGQPRFCLGAVDGTTGLATSWNPGVDGTIRGLEVNGSTLYACGDFATVGGMSRYGVAAIDAVNASPTTFDAQLNGTVSCMEFAGTHLVMGGWFSECGGQPRQYLASVDATTGAVTHFDPRPDNTVSSLAVSGTTIYVGGDFSTIAGEPRTRLAALDATAGTAGAWDPAIDGTPTTILASGTNVYVGGYFHTIDGQPRDFLGAIDATDGSVTSWDPAPFGGVSILVQNGPDVLAGGDLRGLGGVARTGAAALDLTTGEATAWNPVLAGRYFGEYYSAPFLHDILVVGSTVYLAGGFTSVNGTPREVVAAVDAGNGALTGWNPAVSGGSEPAGWALASQGSTLYLGGAFMQAGGASRRGIAALDMVNADATPWDPSAGVTGFQVLEVRTMRLHGTSLYVSGQFSQIGGEARSGLAELELATGRATSWNPAPDGDVLTIEVIGSTVYLGGFFFNVGGEPRASAAAVNAATGLATSWEPFPQFSFPYIYALAANGSNLYVGGGFSSIGGKNRAYLAEVDGVSGTATGFDAGANGHVTCLELTPSTLYVGGGSFTSIGGQPAAFIAALAVTGGCTPPAIAFCPADVSVECGSSIAPSSTGEATATGTGVSVSFSDAFAASCGSTGVITRTWTATGTCGTASCEQEITIVDTTAPVVTITGPASGSVHPVGNAVSFTGSFTDACGSPHTATWTFDSITQPGAFTEGAPGVVTAGYTFTAAGVYEVALTVTDHCDIPGTATQIDGVDAMVVIYDPSAGFVTGSGSIDSPPGAYPASPLLAGKASFGFVSKYKKGATVPTGETEFQFNAAGLSFISTTYEWLVVSGSRAQYKGTGTVNGVSGHGFLLTVVDGAIAGGGGTDRFRIKITNASGVVYDNEINDPDDATPNTALRSGSIIINAGGKKNAPAATGEPRAEGGGAASLSASIPIEFGLSRNRPNPFDRATRIEFSLPERSRLTLVVFDLAGREVRTLADGEWEPGRHAATLSKAGSDGSTLGAGVYFVRMNARSVASGRSFTSLRKMVVLE